MEKNLKNNENHLQSLSNEFPIPTKKEWRVAVDKLLKGAPYEKIMLTKTYEGIQLEPMYLREDVENLPIINSLPGFPPYVRSSHLLGYKKKAWDIAQEIPLPTADEFNQAILSDLKRGQTAINLILDTATRDGLDPDQSISGRVGENGTSIASLSDLKKALNGVYLGAVDVNIEAYSSGYFFGGLLVALYKKQGIDFSQLKGNLGIDPIGELAEKGSLSISLDVAYDEVSKLIKWTSSNAQQLKAFTIHGYPYNNSGASAVEELGYMIATATEYINQMLERGIEIDTIATNIKFSFSLGSNFFMEVAKLRAARLLWANIISNYGGNEESQKMIIHVRTSSFNKTIYDPYVNMLRTTTEALSGVIGGCDSMHVSPFDESVSLPNEFSRRISRNTQLILKDECNLDAVIDPAGGSFYIESLTNSLADEAWKIFQKIEESGSILKALKDGIIQDSIAETVKLRKKNRNIRKDIFLGTNMYANLSEEPLEVRKPDFEKIYDTRSKEFASIKKDTFDFDSFDGMVDAFINGMTIGQANKYQRSEAVHCGIPVIKPLTAFRITEDFEEMRQKVENFAIKKGSAPKVFLANMGPIPQHKPRADFSTGFFQVAGFDVLSNNGFSTVEEAAEATVKSNAPIVVICSTDKTYPVIVPKFCKLIKDKNPETIIVLAGNPKAQIEEHKKSGVDYFIYLRANIYEILSGLIEKLIIADNDQGGK